MIIEEKEPSEFLQDFWNLNDKYPDFVDCVEFDGASPAKHNMEVCKIKFKKILTSALDLFLKELTTKIEIAEEEENLTLKRSLLSSRKTFRELYSIDLSSIDDIESLLNLIPEELKPHWNKK